MLVIAHRGASGLEPENTMRAFRKAEEIGVDMIELDVRQAKDGELVISHDASLKRLFGDIRMFSDLTVAELKKISTEHGREIPTLDEVLSTIRTDLDLDIKVHGIEKLVYEKIQRFPNKVLVSSIYPGVLKKFRSLDEKLPLGLIIGRGELHLLPVINSLTKKLNLTSIHPKYMIVYKASVALLRSTKRKIFVWTINEPHEYERVKSLGVDGVFTDNPQIFKNYAG